MPPWQVQLLILGVELVERVCFYSLSGSQEFFLEQLGYTVEQSAALNSAFTTLCYVWPLLGGYVADTYAGRYSTILGFTTIYLVGMLICSLAALPGNLRNGGAYLVGAMGLVSLGTGGIKPNISNFGADQYNVSTPEGRSGQEAFYTYFYVVVNMGAFASYGFLTTLCSDGGPYGPFSAYMIGTLLMGLALAGFICNRSRYTRKKLPSGDTIRGVVLHVATAARRGSGNAACVLIGWPLMLAGTAVTVVAAFLPGPPEPVRLTAIALLLVGIILVAHGCHDAAKWVNKAASNRHVSRSQTADFLRIMPTLIFVNIAFNALYNCMGFWYQLQACQMDARINLLGRPTQLNGSFFNVADCLAIIAVTPVVLKVNSLLTRQLGVEKDGKQLRNWKLVTGCLCGAISVAWAACLEVARRRQPILHESSKCAPPGVFMSNLSAWHMVAPYAIMGLAEVYVNPTLYYLSYSQTPLRLRSTAQGVCLLMSSVSSGIFTLLSSYLGDANDLNKIHLEHGYYASLVLCVPFLVVYCWVQASLVERDFETGEDMIDRQEEGEAAEEEKGFREIVYQRFAFFRDYMTPRSIAGSPPASPLSSPPSFSALAQVIEHEPSGYDLQVEEH